jgi:hypothetical protein
MQSFIGHTLIEHGIPSALLDPEVRALGAVRQLTARPRNLPANGEGKTGRVCFIRRHADLLTGLSHQSTPT